MAIPVPVITSIASAVVPNVMNAISSTIASHNNKEIEKFRGMANVNMTAIKTGGALGNGVFSFFSDLINAKSAEKQKKIEADRNLNIVKVQTERDKELERLKVEDCKDQRDYELKCEKINKEHQLKIERLQTERDKELEQLKVEDNKNKYSHEEYLQRNCHKYNLKYQAEQNRHEEVIRQYEYEQQRFIVEKQAELINRWIELEKHEFDSKMAFLERGLAFIEDVCEKDLQRCREQIKQNKVDEQEIMYFSGDMSAKEKQYYLAYLSESNKELKKEMKEIKELQETSIEKLNKQMRELEVAQFSPFLLTE